MVGKDGAAPVAAPLFLGGNDEHGNDIGFHRYYFADRDCME